MPLRKNAIQAQVQVREPSSGIRKGSRAGCFREGLGQGVGGEPTPAPRGRPGAEKEEEREGEPGQGSPGNRKSQHSQLIGLTDGGEGGQAPPDERRGPRATGEVAFAGSLAEEKPLAQVGGRTEEPEEPLADRAGVQVSELFSFLAMESSDDSRPVSRNGVRPPVNGLAAGHGTGDGRGGHWGASAVGSWRRRDRSRSPWYSRGRSIGCHGGARGRWRRTSSTTARFGSASSGRRPWGRCGAGGLSITAGSAGPGPSLRPQRVAEAH